MRDTDIIIGNYRILSTIASGSFGRVYLACHHVLTQRIVALKLMHEVPLSSDLEREQFLQEARILEMLRHPYILPILDVGIHEGMPYIVSEYASGNSLRKRLLAKGSQPLSCEESQTILLQVGHALQYAHHRDIIHRDLKPENILFNAKGHALLADFGLATMLATTSVKYMSNAGTPRYMAPEQFQGQVSRESDQYALGCIAYELFTGRAAFHASDMVALMYQHVNQTPVPLTQHNPNLPAYIEQAVLKALMKQRNERHNGVDAFLVALQKPESAGLLIADTVQVTGSSMPAGRATSERNLATLPLFEEVAEDDGKTLVKERETVTPVSLSNSEEVVTSHSTNNYRNDAATSLLSVYRQKRWTWSLMKGYSRSNWLAIAITCIAIVVIIAGSSFWAVQAASSHGRDQKASNSVFEHLLSPTSTAEYGATPTASSTAQSTPTPTASTVQSTPTPTPSLAIQPTRPLPTPITASQPIPVVQPTSAPQPTPTPKPRTSMSYYVCGDQVALTDVTHWVTVQPGTVVNTSDYSGPVSGYTGSRGDPNNSSGSCSGRFQWAWNQNPVQAIWTWSNAYLPNGTCSVWIYIPKWYSGSPDARYTLTISSSVDSASYTFDTQNQNQVTGGVWIALHISGQMPSISMPKSTNNTYTLALALVNGGTPNWYLGADAIRFDCSANL